MTTDVFSLDEQKNQPSRPNEKIETDETSLLIDELSWFRFRLLQNGYEPIPVLGKRPQVEGWTSGDIDLERIVGETIQYLGGRSTGLRTGVLVGVDIDLHNDEHADIIKRVVEDTIGPTPLHRRGSKGAMLCYRKAGTSIGKIIIRDPAADRTLFEIFGQGGQFVAYGIHPDTHRPYVWLTPGQEPLLVPLSELPEVSTDLLHDLRDRVFRPARRIGLPTRSDHEQNLYRTTTSGRNSRCRNNNPKVPRHHTGWR